MLHMNAPVWVILPKGLDVTFVLRVVALVFFSLLRARCHPKKSAVPALPEGGTPLWPFVAGCAGMLTLMNMETSTKRPLERSLSGLARLILITAIGLLAISSSPLSAAELQPKTLKAFDRYVAAAEARMKRDESHPNDFLYIESLPKPQYDAAIAALKQGRVHVEQVRTSNSNGKSIDIPDGMIHHWIGDVFIPGRSVTSALNVLRNYDNFKNFYKPEVIRSRLVKREDEDDYNVYLRLQKQSIVTVTLDTWYQIHFTPAGKNSGYSRSVSTRIQQVDDAGKPSEHLEPAGNDSGYLWRINSYWRYQQLDNGVIVEWESIALSRDIPFLVAWFVNPLVRNIAREAVTDMLTATRKAVLADSAPSRQPASSP